MVVTKPAGTLCGAKGQAGAAPMAVVEAALVELVVVAGHAPPPPPILKASASRATLSWAVANAARKSGRRAYMPGEEREGRGDAR